MITVETELLTKNIWKLLPIGVVIHDAQGKIIEINDYGLELLQIHPLQVIGKDSLFCFWEVVKQDGSPFLSGDLPYVQTLNTGKPTYGVVLSINTNPTKWLCLDAVPKLDEAGKLIGVITTFKDITAEKTIEREQKNQAQRIQALLNNTFDGVVVLQGDRIIEANPRFTQMLGYSMTELLQISPKDWEPLITHSSKPIGIDTHIYQTTHYRKDGSTYEAEVSINSVIIEDKEFFIYIVRDITYQKLTEQALRESKEQFVNMFRSVSDAIYYIDRDYTIRYVNNVLLARFNLIEEEMIDHTMAEILGTTMFHDLKPKIDRCLKGEVIQFFQWITYPAIGRRYMSVTYSPYRNNKKEILGVVGTSRDLTKQKLTEDKLEIQRKQDNLIATIARELLVNNDYYKVFDISLPILRDYLKCDRVVVYEFNNSYQAKVVQSAFTHSVESMLNHINKYVLAYHIWEQYRVQKISDIELANLNEDYLAFLRSFSIRAKMVVGIWVDQKLWGAISVHQLDIRNWEEIEADFLCRVSTLIGIAISRSNLFQKTQTQLTQSNLLYRLANYIKDTINLQEIFDYITQQVWSLYPNNIVLIEKFVSENLLWQTVSKYPLDIVECRVEHEGNLISQTILDNQVVAINDTDTLTDPICSKIAEIFRGAWLLTPICLDDRVWGCLSVKCSNPIVWTEETKQFMKTIANQITIAINNDRERKNRIKAETTLKELNQNLEQQVLNRSKALLESQILLRLQYEQEKILSSITAKIRDSLELNQILQTTTQELLNLIDCDRVLIYAIQSDGKGKIVAESVQPDIPSLNGMAFSSEVFPISCYDQYLKGKVTVVKSYQDTDIECLKDFMNSLGVKALITTGIIFDQKLWGLLILHHCKTDRDWQNAGVNLVQKISVPLSIAIKQANLYQQMENELTKRIELNRSLKAKLRQEQLINLILERVRWSFDLDELLMLVTSELRYFLNADRVTIRVIKNGQVTSTYQSPNDSPVTQIDCKSILDNFSNGSYFMDSYRLTLPIVTGANTICGILTISNHKPTKWDIGTIKLLDQIACQIALGIEKNYIQQKMERELKQKDSLLKEVHHRVKNNLQIMSSLFRLQARNIDKSLNPAIEDAQSRIYAMALVHEQLYGGEKFDSIDMKTYVTSLVTTIFNTYNVRSGHIELVINIPQVNIPLDKTVPLGLIFNELITNAIKYAFPSGNGIIKIDVTKLDKSIEIIVADNGVGLPSNFTPEKVSSLGILLVNDLTEQLEGKFTFHNNNGAVFTLHIPID